MPADLSPELLDLLALNLIPNLGPRLTAALLTHFGSARAIRGASAVQLRQVPLIGPNLSEQFAAALATVSVDRERELIEKHGVDIVALGTAEYPASLAQIANPPHLLYVRGTLTPADQRAVAVVGSRGCTSYGRRVTENLSTGLVHAGFTVVSGLASDTGKHKLAQSIRNRLILKFTSADVKLGGWGEKRCRVMAALDAEPGASSRGIAQRLGLNEHFVGRIRRELSRANKPAKAG
jgi:hypothetical protein